MAEAGDLRRVTRHPQFLKFCGLDLATCQSGTFRGRTKLSKYGNAVYEGPFGWRRRSLHASATTASATSSVARSLHSRERRRR
ncbi:transposase [Mesorhizobium captivum]|uniref:transposase n=1 Tax=Mesorhizobium captivum TaxID=3072319 RepID=UPI003D6B1A10